MILKISMDEDLLPQKKLINLKTKDAGRNVRNLKPNQADTKSFLVPGYLESNAVPLEISSKRKPASVYVSIL